MNNETIILPESDEAAKYVTNISGWIDRNGLFFGDNEKAARYSGCTHVPCKKCQTPTEKNRQYCDECAALNEIERYNKLKKKKWDYKTPLYSYTADEFFYDLDEIFDFAEEHSYPIADMQLVICNPIYLQQVNEDYWADNLAEGSDLPIKVLRALEVLNEEIRKSDPVSWEPGKFAATIIYNELIGDWIEENCPKCRAKMLANKKGDKWCSHINCDYSETQK